MNISNLSFEDCEQLVRYSQTVISVPTPSEMINLVAQAKAGDQNAREQVILGTVRYIINTVKTGQQSAGVTIGDLIGESVMAIDKAISKFDPSKGVNFLTYASWWIDFAQDEMHRHSKEIIPSKNYIRYMGKIQAAIDSGISADDYEAIAEYTKIPEKTVRNVMVTMITVSSIFDETGHNNDKDEKQTVLDTVCSSEPTADTAVAHAEVRPIIENILSDLPDRDRQIMVLRYGLFDEEPHTLREISDIVGVSNERVRQIENDCLLKLKDSLAKMNCSATSDIF